jgi:hypothetical protein
MLQLWFHHGHRYKLQFHILIVEPNELSNENHTLQSLEGEDSTGQDVTVTQDLDLAQIQSNKCSTRYPELNHLKKGIPLNRYVNVILP